MNLHKKTVFWLLLVCVLLSLCKNVNLHRLYDTPGETWPSRVEIKVGDSVNIFCHMNLTAFQNQCTVRDLYFWDTITQKVVPSNDVITVNETTIMYTLNNAPEQQTVYRCKCHNSAIADTKVFVGFQPHERSVTDFVCRSFDYMRMQCNFTKPDNPVICKYNLSLHFDDENYKYYPKCDFEKPPLVICEAAGQTYRPNDEIYHYELYEENSLGRLIQRFDINNTEIMILAKPGQNFSSIEINTDSASFSFRMPKYESFYRSKGLQWQLSVKPQNFSSYTVNNARPTLRTRNEFVLSLDNLTYAYYEYQLHLRVRLQGPHTWSDPFTYKFRTAPRRPDRPPRIDVGGFYIDPSETTVHLYWELLHPYEFNGENFSYVIQNQNGKQFITDSNSASFHWQKGTQYEFKLRSINHLGLSDSFSQITIPAMWPASKSKTHTTPAVHNIYHETNGTFTLTWEAPDAINDLVDYTVFWCRSKRALLNGCEGSIHFQHVSSNVHKFTTSPQDHTLNLAVSANYKDFNTGMHWTECTMNEESDLVKMEPEVEAISATSIKIQWTSEKICPSIFDGYNLSFCEVAEPETPIVDNNNDDVDYVSGVQYNCREDNGIGNTTHYKIIPKTQTRFTLTDLKPYTLYKIEMFMYSMRKVGKTSDAQVVQTFEAAPSHPRQLNYSHITNTSASISWLPPREPNGLVRYYTVVLNNEKRKIQADPNDKYGPITYNLKNLNSSTSYKVYVLAHTVSMSQMSNDIHFTTLVGYPEKPRIEDYKSNNEPKIEWAKASERTDFYEVAITIMQNDEIIRRRISVVIDMNECVYKVPHCFDRNHRTIVDVRAVNAALLWNEVDQNDLENNENTTDNDEKYYKGNDDLSCASKVGTTEKQTLNIEERTRETYKRYKDPKQYRLYKSGWQTARSYNCASIETSILFAFTAFSVLSAVGIFVLIYFIRRKYNKMANIHCTLPAGLDAYVSKDLHSVSGSTFPHDFLAVIKGDSSSNARITESTEPSTMAQRASECHNEERCLLEATSQDSISLTEPKQQQLESMIIPTSIDLKNLNEVSIASNPRFDSNFDVSSSPQITQTRTNEIVQPDGTLVGASANYIQATDFATTPAMPQFPTPIANGYIKPNALGNWQNIVTQPSARTATCGYVTVESIDANPQTVSKPTLPELNVVPNNNGYIQANLLEGTKQNLPDTGNNSQTINETALQPSLINTTNDSYTTLEQLGKMSASIPTTNNWNRNSAHSLTQDLGIPIVAAPNVASGISGYVTPRELTAFGQQQHQQRPRNMN